MINKAKSELVDDSSRVSFYEGVGIKVEGYSQVFTSNKATIDQLLRDSGYYDSIFVDRLYQLIGSDSAHKYVEKVTFQEGKLIVIYPETHQFIYVSRKSYFNLVEIFEYIKKNCIIWKVVGDELAFSDLEVIFSRDTHRYSLEVSLKNNWVYLYYLDEVNESRKFYTKVLSINNDISSEVLVNSIIDMVGYVPDDDLKCVFITSSEVRDILYKSGLIKIRNGIYRESNSDQALVEILEDYINIINDQKGSVELNLDDLLESTYKIYLKYLRSDSIVFKPSAYAWSLKKVVYDRLSLLLEG